VRSALDAYVFGNAVGERLDSIKTAWKATCGRAGIEDLHFHDLQREAAWRWFEAGVPLHHIRDLLGHADISTTSRYIAVTPTELQRSMQMAEERQREQTQQRRSGNKQTRKRALPHDGDAVVPGVSLSSRPADQIAGDVLVPSSLRSLEELA
jgi:DNA-binding transcriptional MerR regulator